MGNNEKIKIKQIFESYDRHIHDTTRKRIYCKNCGSKCIYQEKNKNMQSYCDNCQKVQYVNPYPGVSVLIVHNDKIILVRRKKDCFAGGKWCLPCGYVEFNEDIISAAYREVLEETGLFVKMESIIHVTNNFFNKNLHTIVIVFKASLSSGVILPGEEIDDVVWVTKNTYYKKRFAFEADKEIIKRFFMKKNGNLPVENQIV